MAVELFVEAPTRPGPNGLEPLGPPEAASPTLRLRPRSRPGTTRLQNQQAA